MSESRYTVLVVGATGSIGRLVVEESVRAGHRVVALVRDDGDAAKSLPAGADVVVGDLTSAESMAAVMPDVDAVVFTQGSHGGAREAELVDYGAVRNTLAALRSPARIALMTAIGVTKHSPGHDWKRRGERLIRASGQPYTIVRPGWFDYNDADQHRLVMLQGDTRWAGNPSDGVVARRQIAQTLVSSLTCAPATSKTLELVAEHGPATTDFASLFAALDPDRPGELDGVGDRNNMPSAGEPGSVTADREFIRSRF